MGDQWDQGVFRRGLADAEMALKTIRFWLVELVVAPISGLLTSLYFPNGSGMSLGITVAMGALLGVLSVAGLVLLWKVLLTPYRQRDEARAELERLAHATDDVSEAILELQGVGYLIDERQLNLAEILFIWGQWLLSGASKTELENALPRSSVAPIDISPMVNRFKVMGIVDSKRVTTRRTTKKIGSVPIALPPSVNTTYSLMDLGRRILHRLWAQLD